MTVVLNPKVLDGATCYTYYRVGKTRIIVVSRRNTQFVLVLVFLITVVFPIRTIVNLLCPTLYMPDTGYVLYVNILFLLTTLIPISV